MSAQSPSGKLYLIPTPLGPEAYGPLPEQTLAIARELRYFVVEKGKVARQFLKGYGLTAPLQECTYFELNKFTEAGDIPTFLQPAQEGHDIGLLSDAGAPGVADPGAVVVRLAHQLGIEVVPLTGPSSILLALMAAGLDGQQFRFHGYLSPKRPQLARELQQLERESRKAKQTELFIEAPYRNDAVFETALQSLAPTTDFSVATDLTLASQYIRTNTIAEWQKKTAPALHKRPTLFLLLAR